MNALMNLAHTIVTFCFVCAILLVASVAWGLVGFCVATAILAILLLCA